MRLNLDLMSISAARDVREVNGRFEMASLIFRRGVGFNCHGGFSDFDLVNAELNRYSSIASLVLKKKESYVMNLYDFCN